MRLSITETASAEGFTGAAAKRAHKAGLAAAAAYWHEKFLPLRFNTGAPQRYGFRPRQRAYEKYKASTGRAGGLRYDGKLKTAAVKKPEVKVTAKGASIKMSGLPDYIVQRRKTPAARMRQYDGLVREGVDPLVAAERAGMKINRELRRRLYKELTGKFPGAGLDDRAWRAATEAALVPFAEYPNIRLEMVRTPKWEADALAKIYDAAAQTALRTDSKGKSKRRKKIV